MPMFYTPSPRKFHYKPRFYDPEKEEWNKMKQRYGIDGKAPVESTSSEGSAMQSEQVDTIESTPSEENASSRTLSEEIAYFEARDRELERKEKAKSARFGWKDLVRKREMPTFNYQPRFSGEGGEARQSTSIESELKSKKKRISRRFDIEDTKYFEPIPAGKIMLYALGVTLILAWIFLT